MLLFESFLQDSVRHASFPHGVVFVLGHTLSLFACFLLAGLTEQTSSPWSFPYLSGFSKSLPFTQVEKLPLNSITSLSHSTSPTSGVLASHTASGISYHFNVKTLILVSLTN